MSELKVDKITPRQGTTLTLGDSGDTINFGSGVLPNFENLTVTGDLTVDTNSLKVDSTNNFVGIGTATPAVALDVIGAITATGNITGTLATAAQPNITSVGTLTGLTTTGDINFGDNDKAVFGAGSDLQIYHNGSKSIIEDTGTGDLDILADTSMVLRRQSNNDPMAVFNSGSSAILYHNGNSKISTTSTGIDVTGTVVSDGLTVDTNTLYVDSTNNKVGIGLTNPNDLNSVANNLVIGDGTTQKGLTIYSGTTGSGNLFFADGTTGDAEYRGYLEYIHTSDQFTLGQAGLVRFRINSTESVFNESSYDHDFRVESDTNTHSLFVQGSDGNVGIGTGTVRGKLTVSDGNTNSAGEAVYQAYIVGTARNFTSDATGMLTIQSTDNMSADKGGSIAFGGRAITGNASGANWAGISGFKENSTSAQYGGYLGFSVRNNVGGGALAEAMRITSDGKVGIGTTSPDAQLHIVGTDTTDQIIFENTDSGAPSSPDLVLYKNSSSPANNDILARIDFRANNSLGSAIDFMVIYGQALDVASGSEDFVLQFEGKKAGSNAKLLSIGSSEVVINDDSNDVDFRVESNSLTHMLFVDGGTDKIGINNSSPQETLHLKDGNFSIEHSGASGKRYTFISESNGNLTIKDSDTASNRMIIQSGGNAVFSGTVTATSFSGDGSGLTNVPAGVSSVNMRVFTSSTTYTPTSGTKFFLVYCTGGGGGSGGGNSVGNSSYHAVGGAGAGGTAIRTYNATEMGATSSITIGGGGGAGGSGFGGVGGTGGTSTFNPAGTGTTLTGNGGIGSQTLYGDNIGNSPAGLGGTASGGIINKKGEDGSQGDYGRAGVNMVNNQGSFCQQSGSGGNSFWGQGGAAKLAENSTNLLIAGESGSLGGGASGLATRERNYQSSGTAGSSGVVVIMEYA